jgi:hypothetical protein
MPSQCLPLLHFDAARVTRLTSCGAVVDSTCSYATTRSVISVAMTNNNQDRQDYLQLNGRGEICVDLTTEPQLRWINVEITFCKVDPELFNIITGEPLVLNDESPTPRSIGWDTTTSGPLNSFFAFEAWADTGDSCDDGVPEYAYMVLPFVIGAQVGDVTWENANINFTVSARTKANALWGTGPYNVRLGETAPTLGQPLPLITAIGSNVHRRIFWTELPPPPTVCGCQDLTPALLVTPTTGPAATPRVMTIPTDADGPILPGYVNWGDATPATLVTSGTTVNHTYAPGSYVATYKPTKYSSPTYTSVPLTVS